MGSDITAQGRVLVVDDQQANLRVVSALLARHGYDVAVADNGPAALAMVEAQVPDLILLDMMMPGMDGFGVMAEIRERALLRVPVVFLTAAQDRELLLRAFGAGAVDYVTKPFIPEELMARVDAHVGLKLARDRLERVARERQELVNLVAHDLKNPLSSVLFASDMLIQGACKPERVPRYLQMIHDSAGDAIGYIRNYLETQAEAAAGPRGAAVTGSSSLGETLAWLQERYELQLEARGMRLLATAPTEPGRVAMSPLALRQVAENLVTNAMKYAATAASWNICSDLCPRLMAAGGAGRGTGIPEYKQRDLFKPFHRLSETDPANGLSSGLGLSLAKQIIGNAGGQLWYEDREGGGARFIIELPQAG